MTQVVVVDMERLNTARDYLATTFRKVLEDKIAAGGMVLAVMHPLGCFQDKRDKQGFLFSVEGQEVHADTMEKTYDALFGGELLFGSPNTAFQYVRLHQCTLLDPTHLEHLVGLRTNRQRLKFARQVRMYLCLALCMTMRVETCTLCGHDGPS